jgi:hypothetical protein
MTKAQETVAAFNASDYACGKLIVRVRLGILRDVPQHVLMEAADNTPAVRADAAPPEWKCPECGKVVQRDDADYAVKVVSHKVGDHAEDRAR